MSQQRKQQCEREKRKKRKHTCVCALPLLVCNLLVIASSPVSFPLHLHVNIDAPHIQTPPSPANREIEKLAEPIDPPSPQMHDIFLLSNSFSAPAHTRTSIRLNCRNLGTGFRLVMPAPDFTWRR
ncbi:unnamed protein product [Periconia digitata]|uniref:Ig-like domain-containing protein n=1 Tax=Periconia digitata TaxID=1303443 RepID=A0A9W4U7P4_9PLEO|nr:unnamed protein product [Periconia digitata]